MHHSRKRFNALGLLSLSSLVIITLSVFVFPRIYKSLGTPKAATYIDFPADQGPHPSFAAEWWYLNLLIKAQNLDGSDKRDRAHLISFSRISGVNGLLSSTYDDNRKTFNQRSRNGSLTGSLTSSNSFQGSVSNGSFENRVNNWTRSAAVSAPDFFAVDCQQYGPCKDGKYYLKMKRANSGDAYIVSDWIETGGNVSGKSFTVSFSGKSHEAAKSISVGLQRYPKSSDWSQTYVTLDAAEFIHTKWRDFVRNATFPQPANGNNSSKVRIVLRTTADYWPVYYDSISLGARDRQLNLHFVNENSNMKLEQTSSQKGLRYILKGNTPEVGQFDLVLKERTVSPTGYSQPLLWGCTGRISVFAPNDTYYYSIPDLDVSGTVTDTDGAKREVGVGKAWMDHQWFSSSPPSNWKGHYWTGFHLTRSSDLYDPGPHQAFGVVTQVFTDGPKYSYWVRKREDGTNECGDQVEVTPLRYASNNYPDKWRVTLQKNSSVIANLTGEAFSPIQVFSSSLTGPDFFEPAAFFSGNADGKNVTGLGFLETHLKRTVQLTEPGWSPQPVENE